MVTEEKERSAIAITVFQLLLVLLVGLALRLFLLGQVPPALHFDEMAVGVDALLLSRYGLDQYGFHYPILFRALDDYKGTIYIYSLAALEPWLAMDEWGIRLPGVLYGVATLLMTYALCLRGSGERSTALWAAFFLAVMPWHVHYSRISFDAIAFTFLYAAFLLAAWQLVRMPGVLRSVVCGVLGGLLPYSYTPAKLLAAVSLLVTGVLLLKARALRPLCILTATSLLVASAYIVVYLDSHASINLRFYNTKLPLEEMPLAFLSHFSPQFLLTHGDHNPRHNPNGGMLDWYYALLLPAFAYSAVRARSSFRRLLLLLLFALPILGAFSREYPHATRLLVATPVFACAAALGLRFLCSRWWSYKWFQPVLAILLLASAAPRWYGYFTEEDQLLRHLWDADQMEVLRAAKRLVPADEAFHAETVIRHHGWMLLEPPTPEELEKYRDQIRQNPLRYDPLDAAGKFSFIRLKRIADTIPAGWSIISQQRYESLSEAEKAAITSHFENAAYLLVFREGIKDSHS